MTSDNQHGHMESLSQELERVQRNLQPQDIIRNDVSVDAFLWKGIRNPTRVQRIAFVLFGGLLVVSGISVAASMGTEDFIVIPCVIGLAFSAAGIKVASNAFRRRSK